MCKQKNKIMPPDTMHKAAGLKVNFRVKIALTCLLHRTMIIMVSEWLILKTISIE